ncbi:MAG: SPOR domain-containing protein [Porticoccaceae bacterium]
MSNGLQQRIVGALVLGALGLIILPIIFDFADPLKIDRTSKLPPAPEIKSIDVAKAQRPDSSAKLGETDSLFDTAKSQPADDSTEGFYGLEENDLPRAWVLQAGSFEEKTKAEKLMQQLRDSGFKAFVKTATIDNKMFYRVYVGPKADKRRAMAEKARIDSNFSTDAIVLQYVP